MVTVVVTVLAKPVKFLFWALTMLCKQFVRGLTGDLLEYMFRGQIRRFLLLLAPQHGYVTNIGAFNKSLIMALSLSFLCPVLFAECVRVWRCSLQIHSCETGDFTRLMYFATG